MKLLTVDERLRNKRNDATGRQRLNTRRGKPFVGWDGEGFNHNGKHYYGLFGNSLGHRVTGNLTWQECIRLLMEAPKYAHHVIFAGTYDVVMMFRNEPQIFGLLQAKPVTIGKYRITFLRGKMLRVTDLETSQSRTLYDVFTFFGTSFVKACEEYLGTSELLTAIAEMKAVRNTFTVDDIKGSVNDYMGNELTLLVELCTTLRQRLAEVDIHPTHWHGPGAVASTVLKAQKVKLAMGEYTEQFRREAECAYYGGRFEQFQRGTYEGTVYQYDIRSAYPHALRLLPDLTNMEYVYCEEPSEINPYGLYQLDWESDPSSIFDVGHLPFRSQLGSIYYPPHFGKGMYWGIEVPLAAKAHAIYGWIPVNTDDETIASPFQFVEEMYQHRAELKAQGLPQQLALKLAMNSIYGKLAQSKGARYGPQGWVYPTFHNTIWAGWITACTRRMISDALHTVAVTDLIATETDSIFSKVPLDLPLGTELGAWDLEVLEGIKYVQSGVSLVKKGGKWSFKTRGFTVKRQQNEAEIWGNFLGMRHPEMKVQQTRFITDPRQHKFGKWVDTQFKLTLDKNPLEKRVHTWCQQCEGKHPHYDTTMHLLHCPPLPPTESTPYNFVWRTEDENKPIGWSIVDDPSLGMEYVT